ncbi:MAG: phage tail protein I [Chloroflexota bacterium]
MSTHYHRLQITGPSGEYTFDLKEGTAVTGRQSGVDLLLEDKLISRRHASFTCTKEICTLTDLKSSNGTKINEEKLIPHTPYNLNHGDVIEIGPFALTYTLKPITKEPESELVVPESGVPESVVPEPEVSEPIVMVAESEPEPALEAEPPTPPPPEPPPDDHDGGAPSPYEPPPGLAMDRSEYLKYLPDIYHSDFMARYLALFESIHLPIRWNVDNFDMYLSPHTAPDGFLPWLASWFELTLDNSWRDEQRRTLLTEAHEIYAQRGTKKALNRILEIYIGQTPVIDDSSEGLEPFTFTVEIPLKKSEVNVTLVEALINQHKPAYTNYKLNLKR